MIRSRAPVRIDFAGGWTDVALFCQNTPGYVVNAAIKLYAYATVKKLPKQTIETKEYGYKHCKFIEQNKIKIYSADFDIYQEADDIQKLEYDGNADLVKAAIKRTGIQYGAEIITRSNAPAGSGLGTSAAMGVALCGALYQPLGKHFLPYEYAERASEIERLELGILGGKQDQYAAAYGGINFLEFASHKSVESIVRINKLPINHNTILELEKNLVLCYTGKSRLSSNIHAQVVENYNNGDKETHDALANLKRIALDIKRELANNDLANFAELLSANWECQKQLQVTNTDLDAIYDLALKSGAAGGKACGAGGGGCMVFYCPDTEHIVRKKLQDNGVQVIDFTFDFGCKQGLQVWEVSG